MRVDSNTKGHTNWYFFTVQNRNFVGSVRFNICNFRRDKSLYERVIFDQIHRDLDLTFTRKKPATLGNRADRMSGMKKDLWGTPSCTTMSNLLERKIYYKNRQFENLRYSDFYLPFWHSKRHSWTCLFHSLLLFSLIEIPSFIEEL